MEPEVDEPLEPRAIHGAKSVEGSQHPVLDIAFWRGQFPFAADHHGVYFVNGPGDVALAEQSREQAAAFGPLGPSVPVDMFVWAHGMDFEKPWLTRIGGLPWREKSRPWPRNKEGVPLIFLGQVCFVDSHDVLSIPPTELPGEVLLFFGEYDAGYASGGETPYFEWASRSLSEPLEWRNDAPNRTRLPFTYRGIRHRTIQYLRHEDTEAALGRAGYKDGGWHISALQATMIGAYANLPQGWPFEEESKERLLAVFSGFYFRGKWPLCDAPTGDLFISANGEPVDSLGNDGLSVQIGDVGCIYVYRDPEGRFAAKDVGG